MLSGLNISNYILISSLETTFPEGLVIITGETGAGKSILLGALSLVLGAKADASVVGPSGDTCVVEASFSSGKALKQLLMEEDLPAEDDTVIIRRVVSRSGRSRAFINDEPVSLAVLAKLQPLLVDIHSQHQTLLLKDGGFRMDALDLYAGAAEALEECSDAWGRLQQLKRDLSLSGERLRKARAQEDYNRAVLEKLVQARLEPGEIALLETEEKQLSHAEELKEILSGADAILSAEEDSPAGKILLSGRLLEKAGRYIPSCTELAGRLESARLEVEDIAEELSRLNSRIEVSPERLEAVQDRLSLLYSLMQKHGVSGEEELIAVRDSLSSEVEGVSELEAENARLEKEAALALDTYEKAASRLHDLRENGVAAFSEAVMKDLHFLDMEKAVFKVEITPSEPGAKGRDAVHFLFSASGKEPSDISKTASGGELSRIMLCIKAGMARHTRMPSMVFDEIDTGVSGSTADKMGSMVCAMGEDMQVVAITHLPQVAAKGKAHYLVSRENDVTSVRRIQGEERVMEVARMLSGARITGAAVGNARELLSGN